MEVMAPEWVRHIDSILSILFYGAVQLNCCIFFNFFFLNVSRWKWMLSSANRDWHLQFRSIVMFSFRSAWLVQQFSRISWMKWGVIGFLYTIFSEILISNKCFSCLHHVDPSICSISSCYSKKKTDKLKIDFKFFFVRRFSERMPLAWPFWMRLVIKTASVNHKTQNEPNEDELRNRKFCDISGVHRRFTVDVGLLPWRINMANGNLYLRMPFVRRFAYKTQQIHKTNFDCLCRQRTTYLRSTSIRPKWTRKLRVEGEGMLVGQTETCAHRDSQHVSMSIKTHLCIRQPIGRRRRRRNAKSRHIRNPVMPTSQWDRLLYYHFHRKCVRINEFSVSYATIKCHLGSFISFPFHLYTCTIFLPANVEITNNFYQLFAEMRQATAERGMSTSG